MVDNSVIKRLAIQQFGTVLVQGKEYFELDEADIQAFAQAIIENYKASLVPVAYVSKDTAYYFSISDRSTSGVFRYGKFLEATEPLYDLSTSYQVEKQGETK